MRRLDAHRVWLGYRGVEAFAFAVGWTVAPIFFVRELGFSPLELVLAGTALEVAYFLFEIPTGIVADTYGRRLSTIVGTIGLGIGFVATGLADGVGLVLAAAAFMGFTWTFKSGAEEAWITDEVGVEHAGRSFHAGAQAARIGGLVGLAAAVGLALVDLTVADRRRRRRHARARGRPRACNARDRIPSRHAPPISPPPLRWPGPHGRAAA